MIYRTMPSPLGPLTLFEDRGHITGLEFGGVTKGTGDSPLLTDAINQLEAYFLGRLTKFDLPLDPPGSPFQKKVCAAMLDIPYGRTSSYGEIAWAVDSAPRAVGGACGRNPIAIIIPCHRVLASGGRIGGYSGADGLDSKRFLLNLEGAHIQEGTS